MDRKKIVFVLGGRQCVGKSTSAQYMKKRVNEAGLEAAVMSFADPLKDMCQQFLGYSHVQVRGTNDQKSTAGPWRWSELNPELRLPEDKCEFVSGRRMMQIIGTDIFRKNFSKTTWIKLAQIRALSHNAQIIIFDDGRFPNEVEMSHPDFRRVSILIRREGPKSSHESENLLTPEMDFRFIIDNDGTISHLERNLDEILASEGLTTPRVCNG
jgi:hypothetical protein